MVTLKDSLELEKQNAEKLKEIQLKYAMERLGAVAGSFKMKEIELSAEDRMAYRDRDDVSEFNADEEEAEEEGGEGTTVRFSGVEMADDDNSWTLFRRQHSTEWIYAYLKTQFSKVMFQYFLLASVNKMM